MPEPKTAKLGLRHRAMQLERALVGGDRRIRFPASSEALVRSFSFEIGEYLEKLDHSPSAVRLDRLLGGGPLLKDHDRRTQIGVIEGAEIRDRRLEVTARFGNSQAAVEEAADVADGIRRSVSIGYIVHELRLEEKREEGLDVYLATAWEPVEVSVVSIPADPTVGFGRSEGDVAFRDHVTRVLTRMEPSMPEPAPTPTDFPSADSPALVAATRAERHRAEEILALGSRFQMPEEARAAVASGMPLAAFRDQVWARLPEGKPLDAPKTHLGMREGASRVSLSDRETREYVEAFAGWLKGAATGRVERSIATEISREYEKGQAPRAENSLLVGDEFWAAASGRRDLATSALATGGAIVGTDLMPSAMIETLRPRSVVIAMGARTLPGLVGNVDIPRQVSSAAATWIDEGANVVESQPVFDKVSMTPHTLGARVDFTRRLALQGTPAVGGILRSDLAAQLATSLDVAALNGSGTGAVPRGIMATPGIGFVPWVATNALTRLQSVIALSSAPAAANADVGAQGFATSPQVKASLMSAFPDAGAGQPIWPLTRDSDGRSNLLGFPAQTSNSIPKNLGAGTNEHAIIFGNWSDVLVGFWGVLEIFVDPNTLGDSGGLVIRAFLDADVAVRHAQSFAFSTLIP